MTPTQTLNSLARFIIYLGLAAWAYYQRLEILLLVGLGLLATIIFYERADLLFRGNDGDSDGEGEEEGDSDSDSDSDSEGDDSEAKTTFGAKSLGNIETMPRNYGQEGGGSDQGAQKLEHVINSNSISLVPRGLGSASGGQSGGGCGLVVPSELFDPMQGRVDVKARNDSVDQYGAKQTFSTETNGLPHDNQPGKGVIPTFDLRPGTGQESDPNQSVLVKNTSTDANGNHLRSEPAPAEIGDAFCMGDRLGDNIRRDPNVHCKQLPDDSRGCKAGSIVPGGPGPLGQSGAQRSGPGQPGPLDRPCRPSAPNNPFGNILPTDYVADPTRGPACMDRNVQDNNWSQGLFRNVNDVWDRNNGQLIFNTQPATTIPNDRDAFQKWLYQYPYVCKDGDLEACYGIDEIQTRRHGQMQ